MEPPISVPNPNGEHLEAIKPDSPPELPPGVLVLFQGFYAVPYMSLVVS